MSYGKDQKGQNKGWKDKRRTEKKKKTPGAIAEGRLKLFGRAFHI